MFLTVAVQTAIAADVTPPSGAQRNTSVEDFMPHPSISDDFNETWSYQFVFDNGTRAFVNYALLVVPGAGKKIGCDLTFWNFNGKTYTVGRQYPPERLKKDVANSSIFIKTDEYAMEKMPGKGHRVLFSANKNGKFLLDVTFDSAVQGKVPGNGVWNIGKDKFAQYIHIPYGRFTGVIAHDNDTLKVKGYAYMEQTWQTTQATNIVRRTINFSTATSTPMYAGRISLTKDGKPFGYAIQKGDEGEGLLTAKKIYDNDQDYSGEKFPKGTLKISWNESAKDFSFPASKTYQKASILDKIEGWIAKKAFKIAAGEILFYRGKSTGSNNKQIDWNITGGKD